MTTYRELLGLKETITVEVVRARPEGGYQPPEVIEARDLITNAGRIYLAQRIGANVNSPIAHMAIGSGSTAPALGDTALVHEVLRKALAINSAITNNEYTAVCTWAGAADGITSIAITEMGLFNHASSGQGTLYQRNTFAAVTLADSDHLQLTAKTIVGSNTV